MNARIAITLISLGAASWISAQTTVYRTEVGSLLNLVGEIDADAPGKLNDITVVLPPPDETDDTIEETPSDPESAEEKTTETTDSDGGDIEPSGKNKKHETDAEKDAPAETPASDEAAELSVAEAPSEEAPSEPKSGLSVRVERLQTGSTEIDPAQVKLLAPFPAKLLARSPEGWVIESSESAPPFTREVELSPGKRITLNVRPHLLLAEADGNNVFQIAEPGFDASLGYQQNATVAAILSNSIRQLDDDSRQLGTVIDQLQQLLVSLPQTKNTPEPAQDSKTKTNRKR
jgi:hypothetical protein